MGLEKEAERALIAEASGRGYYADHIDCTVDGFADMILLGPFGARLVEMKYGPVSTSLVKAFEPTQPVFQRRLERASFDGYYTCLWDGLVYRLYRIDGLLKLILSQKETLRFKDFAPVTSGGATVIIDHLTGVLTI